MATLFRGTSLPLLCLLLAAPPAGAALRAVGHARILTPPGASSQHDPMVSFGPDGEILVAWQDLHTLVARRVGRDGELLGDRFLLGHGEPIDGPARLVALDDGTFLLARIRGVDFGDEITLRRLDRTGASLSPAMPVVGDVPSLKALEMAARGPDEVLLAWTQGEGDGRSSLRFRRFGPGAGPRGPVGWSLRRCPGRRTPVPAVSASRSGRRADG